MYNKINYLCDVSDKTINIKPKRKHLQSPKHNEIEKCMRVKRTNQNPDGNLVSFNRQSLTFPSSIKEV